MVIMKLTVHDLDSECYLKVRNIGGKVKETKWRLSRKVTQQTRKTINFFLGREFSIFYCNFYFNSSFSRERYILTDRQILLLFVLPFIAIRTQRWFCLFLGDKRFITFLNPDFGSCMPVQIWDNRVGDTGVSLVLDNEGLLEIFEK
jgi:hypothetical protein